MKKIHVYLLIGVMLFASVGVAVTGFAVAQDEVIPFIYVETEGPGKLDPLDAYDSVSIDTIGQIVEGLYRYNTSSAEMESIPALAAAMGTWEPGSGGKNLSVTLKQGVTFHDGTKFNASAVKWNFDRLQYFTYGFDVDDDGDLETHPLGTASQTLFAQAGTPILNRTEIVSEYEVKFVLNVASVIWEKLLAFIACSIVLPDGGANPTYGDTFFNRIDINDDLIGTGPFILTDYEFDNQVVFDYNPDYHLTWGNNHIERMIYLIIPDPVTASLAMLNHEVHWGFVLAEYQEQFDADPDLVSVPVKQTVVFYQQMNLYNMPDGVRMASQFVWNHTYWLDVTLGGRHYELHVPVPDGFQYHHSGFDGEPELDIDTARDIILATPELAANITASGLTVSSTDAEWRTVAESTSPLAEFNYTRYQSTTVLLAATQLQDNLKDIGIKLTILEPIDWSDWVVDYLENPAGHRRLAYSFGGWGPDYNDPINMIEPLYGTNASSNCYGLANATWNQKLLDTYTAVGDDRRDLFYEIQEDFVKYIVPTFYILQRGGTISFNRAYVEETTIDDLKNVFGDLYWFNVEFTPPEKKIPGFEVFTLIGVALGVTVFLVLYMRKRK
jgi:peptide/nickel transport system substrate-binding protein